MSASALRRILALMNLYRAASASEGGAPIRRLTIAESETPACTRQFSVWWSPTENSNPIHSLQGAAAHAIVVTIPRK
jgi:hypothetical protein